MPTSTSDDLRARLRRDLADNAYPGYVYGYPHKKAYRPLAAPVSLEEAWAGEDRSALFCYVHVPFCNQRCSFCNLFTFVPQGASPTAIYLDALAREMRAYARALGEARFARLYLGGGTPTFLETGELRRLVSALRQELGISPEQAHACIEASPETLDAEKIALLREVGFQRLSLGVQSFVPEELRQVNRRFDFGLHNDAIERIGEARFPHFNIDLIYGLPGQTMDTWRQSLKRGIESPATSLFLYPLYVRPLTGLSRRSEAPPAPSPGQMGALYDLAVELLRGAGFRQETMRQFRRDGEGHLAELEYRCQRDGTIGLGAGARSYTQRLHYSTPWRMVGRNIRAVVEEHGSRMRAGDTDVAHGFVLDDDERARRFLLQSLLHDGLDRAAFRELFPHDALERFAPQWEALEEERCVARGAERISLTPRGVRHSDAVGRLFFSERVESLIADYEYDA